MQFESDDERNQHGHRLPQHRRLRLDSSHPPAKHAEPVNHRGVTVGADQGVGVGKAFARGFVDEDDAGEIFEVDLVDDAGVGRDDGEIAESGLAPAEKGVALLVALELEQGIHVERVGIAEFVDLHRVINDKFDRLQRIDQTGVPTQLLHGIAHGGEVDHAGHAGEILQKDTAGSKGDFLVRLGVLVPGSEGAHFFPGDVATVFGAQQIFEQDAQGKRQVAGGDALPVEGIEAVDFVFLVADFEGGAGVETIHGHHGLPEG